MTNPNDAIRETTAALIAATERRLADSREIKSPAELGIVADRSIRRSRSARKSRRRTIR